MFFIYFRLKQFYFNSANLQYFKNLVQVPLLPDVSPFHAIFVRFFLSKSVLLCVDTVSSLLFMRALFFTNICEFNCSQICSLQNFREFNPREFNISAKYLGIYSLNKKAQCISNLNFLE